MSGFGCQVTSILVVSFVEQSPSESQVVRMSTGSARLPQADSDEYGL